jgi:hypothetical protein
MSTELTVYANDISELHQKARQHATSAIDCAMKAGNLLIEAKSNVNHGGWLPFVESTGMSARTAQKYMRLSENAEKLNATSTAYLGIENALKYLAEPKQNPPALGEYLHVEVNGLKLWIWRYNSGYFHFIEETKAGENSSVLTSKKPMQWDGILWEYPKTATMEKLSDLLGLNYAFSLRDIANQDISYAMPNQSGAKAA